MPAYMNFIYVLGALEMAAVAVVLLIVRYKQTKVIGE